MSILTAKRWWPFWAGVAFALVEILSFIISSRPLGASKPFVEAASIANLTLTINPEEYEWRQVEYYSKYEPKISWANVLLLGVIIGSFISSKLSGDFNMRTIPPMWETLYGRSRLRRWMWAFIGGCLVAIGGRLGQGCISGQLISGVTQLGLGGFIFMIFVWIGGVTTALVFYKSRILNITR
jgi:hypothetical protein